MDKRQRCNKAPVKEFLSRFQFGRRFLSVNVDESGNFPSGEDRQQNRDDLSPRESALHSTAELSVDLPSPLYLTATVSNVPRDRAEFNERTHKRSLPETREEDKIITYKRRPRIGRQKKDSDKLLFDFQQSERDDKIEEADGINGQTSSDTKMTGVPAIKEAQGARKESNPSATKNWSSFFGSQRTLAPKRIVGQYFLDLGQSDFSYSTCRTCGMLHAPGHENDEKVHQSFHRNFLKGIQFKGWRDEKVASRIDLKGNRVIVVRAEETYQRTKVQEVMQVMEVELGLTPGWLSQRSCTTYLFVSSAKKIVGCLMAERIQCAYRVVPDTVRISGKDAKVASSKQDTNCPPLQTVDLSGPAVDDTCAGSDEYVSEFPARTDCTDGRKRCKTDEQVMPMKPCPCGGVEKAVGIGDVKPISASASKGRSQRKPAVKQEGRTPPSFTKLKKEPTNGEDERRVAKITDYFLLETPRPGHKSCKSECDANEMDCGSGQVHYTMSMDCMVQQSGLRSPEARELEFKEVQVDEKPDLDFKPVHSDEKPIFDLNHVDTEKKPTPSGSIFPKVEEKPYSSHDEENREPESKQVHMDEKELYPNLDGISPKVEEELSRTNISSVFLGVEKDKEKQLESPCGIALGEGSMHGGKDRAKVMLFGNVKFSRELAAPKRVKTELQDLGKAILCTKEPVPAVCGVRAIWVSQSERRKGIATHLLDAMRKSFVLGISLGTSQFAFSQPTPEGRKFAEQYCRTSQFLVYKTT